MLIEPLEGRRYYSMEFAISVSAENLATTIGAGMRAQGSASIVVYNRSTVTVARHTPKLQANLTMFNPSGDYVTLVAKRSLNLVGLPAGEGRIFKFSVKIPASTALGKYALASHALNPTVFSSKSITIDNFSGGFSTSDPQITVVSPAPALEVSALSTPGSNGKAIATIKNPSTRALNGQVTFEILATVPGVAGPIDYSTDPQPFQDAFELDSFAETVHHLQPGKTKQVPVNLNLAFLQLPFAFTFELFASQVAASGTANSATQSSSLEQITISASPSAAAATVLHVSPGGNITAPISTFFVAQARPTSDAYNTYSLFVDSDQQEGVLDTFGAYVYGVTPSTTVLLSTAHA